MAKRIIKKVMDNKDNHIINVYRDSEFNEYSVRIIGKPEADYFTDDKDDAFATANLFKESLSNESK
ncbi:hypothetical protein LH51_17570 [Nitrincola sp. A-D6]|uniref:hypothetical protein n=1 Tax=Nitrincola sp. A-D6 TaxID=1545442 RepID=UPI00051FC2B2|nr:hypothetical protein [Nitrincola sp. A-D6]KGK41041.1 hypothetical protein LH51_17570 [Nitrincola sp. A-D6]